MAQTNPYLKTYLQKVQSSQKGLRKSHFYSLAINLGQVHNALGQMISDIIKLMGQISFKDESNCRDFKVVGKQKEEKLQTKQGQNNQKAEKSRFISENTYKPEKMQIQHLPSKQSYSNNDEFNQSNKTINLNEFLFSEEKSEEKSIINDSKQLRYDIYKELFFGTKSKDSQQNSLNKSRNQEEDDISSKTQTAEIVRFNENQQKLAATASFQDLSRYALQKEQVVNSFQVNRKQHPSAHPTKVKKQKSPFFYLFDSSQSQSHETQQNPTDLTDLNKQDKLQEIYYPQTQVNEKGQDYLEMSKKCLFSPQIKLNNFKQDQKKNLCDKTFNLLGQTFWDYTSNQNNFQVEQIDEIQSSEKNPFVHGLTKNKNEKNSNQLFSKKVEEYVPRREQKGRKKTDRQDLIGSECPDCKAFYDAVSDDSRNFKEMCKCTSRHKSSTTFMNKHKVNSYSQAFELD